MNAETPPPPSPPPAPPPFPPPTVATDKVRLWNPNAAALWSVLLSPAFGAFLHAQNWRMLGDVKRARANMFWFFLVIVICVVAAFVPAIPKEAQTPLGIGLLVGWYYSQGKPQIQYVKDNFPGGYKKRSIYLALLIGLVAVVVFLTALAFAAGALARSKGASPTEIAAALSQDVKTSVETEWRKRPEFAKATVERVTLSPVENSPNEYKGEVVGRLEGAEQHLPIQVFYEPGTKQMRWKIVPKTSQ